MSDLEPVRFALAAFYQALNQRDVIALDRVWARRLPVSCVHPGWPPLSDRDDILDTWDAVLSNPEAGGFSCEAHKIQRVGELALVLCQEWISGHLMAVTNVFAQEDQAWVLVHHQASPVALGEEGADAPAEGWEDDWDLGCGLDHGTTVGGRWN